MRLNLSVEYALRALLHLARRRAPVRREDVALTEGIPSASLAEVLRALCGAGILRARPGYRGGFELRRDPSAVTLLEVIEAVQGRLDDDRCPMHGGPCGRGRREWCYVHDLWSRAMRDFRTALSLHTLSELDGASERRERVRELMRSILKGRPR